MTSASIFAGIPVGIGSVVNVSVGIDSVVGDAIVELDSGDVSVPEIGWFLHAASNTIPTSTQRITRKISL